MHLYTPYAPNTPLNTLYTPYIRPKYTQLHDRYKRGCQFLGIFLTEAQALKIFRSADVDGTGQLDFVNFQIGEKREERREMRDGR